MSDYQVIKSLANDVTAASKILEDAEVKLAAAIEREVMARTSYTVFCSLGYEDIGFIVHVFNATSEQAGSDVRRLLHALSVDDQCDVWTYSPEETKRCYPAYYKEVKP